MGNEMKCPHCGNGFVLDARPVNLTKTKTPAAPAAKADLKVGVVKSVVDAVEAKVASGALIGLQAFAGTAVGKFGKSEDGLSGGWKSGTLELMRRRKEMLEKGYEPPKDPEKASGDQRAAMIQNALMKGLGGAQ